MRYFLSLMAGYVHCRIGSLEMHVPNAADQRPVHCRIGSLENQVVHQHNKTEVHCRIGSLEIFM